MSDCVDETPGKVKVTFTIFQTFQDLERRTPLVHFPSDCYLSVYICMMLYYLCVCQWRAPAVNLPFSK